jgi:hypothetical protein
MGRRWGQEFDEEQLRNLVRTMTPRSRFFQVLREELKQLGRWKTLPRGKPGDPLKQARQSMLTPLPLRGGPQRKSL